MMLSGSVLSSYSETRRTPYNDQAEALFTDFYQLTMMYGYWKAGKHKDRAVFDLYFRKCPFNGEFAVLAGVNEVVRFLNTLHFTSCQIDYLKTVLPVKDEGFFDYLRTLDGSSVQLYGIKEGTLVFPGVPLLRVEGDLGVCQLIETIVLNLVNYPTLVATNAARHRLAAGWTIRLLEFGARRAQGLDGAMSASQYCYLGGFDGTSNVQAGYVFRIPTYGTHSHAFIVSFEDLTDLRSRSLVYNGIACDDFVGLVLSYQASLVNAFPDAFAKDVMRSGELAAFISYAQSFPTGFLALVDTYDTLGSGIPNFIAVSLALFSLGLTPVGIRLDSGDLVYLSHRAREMFQRAEEKFHVPLHKTLILASNSINEAVLKALNDQGHKIDVFGIGTHLVTCESQPALGAVYKLAELNGRPCMKLSQEGGKISTPGRKHVFRLYSKEGEPFVDFIQGDTEPVPKAEDKIFCQHLLDPKKRCYVIPHGVEELLCLLWDRGRIVTLEPLEVCRQRCLQQLKLFRKDILRLTNPSPYKVSCSSKFFEFFSQLWQRTAPIFTLE